MVTVSSVPKSPPMLFPLVSYDSSLPDETQVTLGCLANDFVPIPITFSWTFKNSSSISSQNIHSFPEAFTGSTYMATSQVLLPSVSILQDDTNDYVVCHAKHSAGNRDVKVFLPGNIELPPNMSVFIPPRNSFSSNSPHTSQLICQASGFRPRTIAMSWLHDGRPVQPSLVSTSAVEAEPQRSEPTTFRVISRLTITESDWLSQSVFTCQALHKGLAFQKNVSYSCTGPCTSTGISVFLLPPSFASIFLTQSAQLTCLVTGLATYNSLEISWSRQNGEALQTHVNISKSHPNSTFSAKGYASVCREEWESGEKFTCTVQHADLPSPRKQSFSQSKDVVKHQPFVFVLPPAQEQLKLRESASITCLVKDFSPPDVFVQWQRHGQPVDPEHYVTSAPTPEPQNPGFYFVYSILTVSEKDWSSGETFSCIVGHEALPLSVTEKAVDKTSESEVSAEEEGFENLSSTASTFIVLFLLSLFYSATVTLFKVK